MLTAVSTFSCSTMFSHVATRQAVQHLRRSTLLYAYSIPGSSTENPLVRNVSPGQFSFSSTSHQHLPVKLTPWRRFVVARAGMAAPTCRCFYRLNGKQSSTSFEDLASATKFQKLVDKFGPAKALETLGTDPQFSAMTVHEWIEHHIDHLTGLRKSSLYDYRSYLKNDIDEALGDLPLTSLSTDDIARWMQGLSEKGASGKTIANKHGFLSSALNAAVRAGRIPSNPAASQRLLTSERQEMVCLSQEDFARLLGNINEFWRPLVEFLVASGCRWGEATALQPSDVDRANNTVRITRALEAHLRQRRIRDRSAEDQEVGAHHQHPQGRAGQAGLLERVDLP